MFHLFNSLFIVLCLILDDQLDTTIHYITASRYENSPYGAILLLYVLALAVPSVAVTVRRLHDTGRSGGYLFLGFLPVIGSVCLLVLLISKGQ